MLPITFSKDSLRSKLLEFFTQKLFWKAEEFLAELARIDRTVSKQALYKELRKLEQEGIVVRATGSYTLRLAWVSKLSSFAERLHKLYLQSGQLLASLEFENGYEEWEFSDLHRADMFWTQLIIALLPVNKSHIIFSWIPHPWFHLVHADREREFWDTVAKYQPQFYVSVGGNTPLDREWTTLVDPTCARVMFGHSLVAGSQSACYELHGDYLVTVKIDKRTTAEINRIFLSVPSLAKFKQQDLMKLLASEGSITIRLEYKTPRVAKLRGAFSRHFKIPIEEQMAQP